MVSQDILRLSARLGMLETLVSDLMLNIIAAGPQPSQSLARVRKATLDKIRFRSKMPPNATAEDADTTMRVLSETAAFAERFFDALESDLQANVGRTTPDARDR